MLTLLRVVSLYHSTQAPDNPSFVGSTFCPWSFQYRPLVPPIMSLICAVNLVTLHSETPSLTTPTPVDRPRLPPDIHRLHHLRRHRRLRSNPCRLLRLLHDDVGHVRPFRHPRRVVQQQHRRREPPCHAHLRRRPRCEPHGRREQQYLPQPRRTQVYPGARDDCGLWRVRVYPDASAERVDDCG
jgi:hypothetical protein